MNQFESTLARVPWAQLPSATGGSLAAPEGIRALLTGTDAAAEEGYWKIDNLVVVQGTLYAGALFVVPFLIQAIRVQPMHAARLYDLLWEIANGSSGPEKIVSYGVCNQPFLYYMPDLQPCIEEPVCVACRAAALRGLSVYATSLEAGSEAERKKALELLESFREHPLLVRSIMQKAMQRTHEPEFRRYISTAAEKLSCR